jgi:hypothetical protein
MQRSADWQKTVAAHGVLISDDRLPINVLEPRNLTTLEGRILVHGEEESSGRNYLLLEATDERVHYIYYTPEMETARNAGGLRTNALTSQIVYRRPAGSGGRRVRRCRVGLAQ